MANEFDIFISYAHIDNQPLVEGAKGWVSGFHSVLERRLAMLLGEHVRIWRDERLTGNDVFDETIAAGIDASRVMISVLTPRYIKSEYCQLEFQAFWSKADGLASGASGKVPFFKVLKTPIPLPKHPEQIQGLLGYEFFETNESGSHTREFSLKSATYREKFIMTLDDLAQEIVGYLQTPQEGKHGDDPDAAGDVVYLAPTTSDLKDHHDAVRRELRERGHTVLPDQRLPLENASYREAVRACLDRAALSVHIIGARYGVVPEDATASTVEIQLELGAEHSARTGRPRLVWMPPNLEISDDRQRALVARLQADPAAQQNAEILITSVEGLKSAVREKLLAQHAAATTFESAPDTGPRWVYILHGEVDEEAVAPLVDHLFEVGYEVRTPLFDGDERELREEHEENLRLCDAFLVYYGHGNERWIRKALADLKKAPGLGRTKPVLAQAVYLGLPESPRKQRYRTHEAEVLRAGESFDPGILASFRASLDAARGGDQG